MNLGKHQKAIVTVLGEAITFGTAATTLLLTVQQQWHAAAAVVAVILGVLGIAKTLYMALTALTGTPAPSLSIGTVTTGETAAAQIRGDAPRHVLDLVLPHTMPEPKA
ncbi:hypothetical protein GFY24_18035 [Nocardia sp. SYP-A9097]|uniref:hypothetical protein n=1 Tax=Nocardia sp. SYP-A9097 TaxID=2663237 RepID=UPI00129AB438|nr:hypothetical protein [Nocardia sp. SYP-A9097]MRH89325.1 hypothetical protein [Nocardia sp. SYP-A9097]